MSTLTLKRRRDIGRQKWQFIAVLVTVILGVMLFAASFNAYLNLGTSLQGSYDRLAMADMTVTGADEGFVEDVGGITGVETAMERRQGDVPMDVGDFSFLGRVVGLPADRQPAVARLDIEKGSYLDPEVPNGVVVEVHAADDFDLQVGDEFQILDRDVTVVGIATSPEYLWPARDRQNIFTPPNSFGVVFVNEEYLEALPSQSVAEQVLVLYEGDVVVEDVDETVTRAAQDANAADIQPLADHPSNATIHLEIDALRTIAFALPLLFLAAAGMAIYVVVTRLVFSQRGVIGTFRATGFTSKAMSKHYRSYGLGVGLIGAIVGAMLGGLLGRAMTALYLLIFGIPDLVARVHVPTIIMSLAFGASAGLLASVPPARTVAAMAPAEAMRGDSPAQGGKRSIFETLIPPLRGAPVRWRMTLRGIGRNKRRSAALVLGVVLAMVLILASWGMMDTMLLAIDRQFNEVAKEDASVVFSVPVGDAELDSVREVDGVRHVEPVVGLAVTINHGSESFTTLLEGYRQDTLVHGFPESLPDEGMLVGRAMVDLLNIEIGDRVTVEFADADIEIETTIEGFVDELGTLAYMEANALEEALGEANPDVTSDVLALPTFTTAKAQFDESLEARVVIDRIREVDGVAAVVDATELRELIEDFQVFFYIFIGMMLVFGGAMAFALIFNIISVNVAERASEFASMRANGLTHRRVANLILGETFLLTAIGVVPGLLAGFWAAVAFVNSFSSDQFPITAELRPASIVGAVLAMFIVAALSLVPAIRSVKKINVGEIVRERAV